MPAGTCWSVPVLLSVYLSLCVRAAHIDGTAGESVTLPCQAPTSTEISVVTWTRSDLSDYVFLYRDAQSDPENQHPSFKSRTRLKNREMTDGDVSLVLENLTLNDTGTYACQVFHSGGKTVPMSVTLTVEAGPDGTSPGLIVGLSVAAGLVVALVVALVTYKKLTGRSGAY